MLFLIQALQLPQYELKFTHVSLHSLKFLNRKIFNKLFCLLQGEEIKIFMVDPINKK